MKLSNSSQKIDPFKKYIKPSDAWSTVFFADPIAIPLAKILARLRIHPNIITIISYIPIILAAYFFWQGDRLSLIYGGLLWQFSIILDFTDGKVARLNNQMTKLGKILDEDTEIPRNLLVFLALMFSQFFYQGQTWLIIGLIIFVYHYALHILAHRVFKIRQGFYQKDYGTPEDQRPKLFHRVGFWFTAEEGIFLMFVVFPILGLPKTGVIVANLLYTIAVIHLIYKNKKTKNGQGI